MRSTFMICKLRGKFSVFEELFLSIYKKEHSFFNKSIFLIFEMWDKINILTKVQM